MLYSITSYEAVGDELLSGLSLRLREIVVKHNQTRAARQRYHVIRVHDLSISFLLSTSYFFMSSLPFYLHSSPVEKIPIYHKVRVDESVDYRVTHTFDKVNATSSACLIRIFRGVCILYGIYLFVKEGGEGQGEKGRERGGGEKRRRFEERGSDE